MEQPSIEIRMRRLAGLLRGADHYRRLRLDAASVELAVTMPLSPSLLGANLSTSPGRPGGYLPTVEAFLRVARAAQTRLVVMTPFLDRRGFGWLREVVEAVPPGAQKILVLRDADRYAVDLGVQHAAWLSASAASVLDYCLSHDHGSGRSLPVETFHAKIVLADEKLAYVGSANVLGTGEGTSLEAGVLVDGRLFKSLDLLRASCGSPDACSGASMPETAFSAAATLVSNVADTALGNRAGSGRAKRPSSLAETLKLPDTAEKRWFIGSELSKAARTSGSTAGGSEATSNTMT